MPLRLAVGTSPGIVAEGAFVADLGGAPPHAAKVDAVTTKSALTFVIVRTQNV
jgi:hypothetical protein